MPIIAAKMWKHPSRSLVRAGTAFWQVMLQDKRLRIRPLLTSMNLQYIGPGGGNATTYRIDGESMLMVLNVSNMAMWSMPLCMSLQGDHKLKHQGQLQYGLFLKGVEMTLKEHTLFFQREFMHIMTLEQFSKQ
jgi:DNA primase large subunit